MLFLPPPGDGPKATISVIAGLVKHLSFCPSDSFREKESLEGRQDSQGYRSGLHGDVRSWDVRMDVRIWISREIEFLGQWFLTCGSQPH